MSEANRKIFNHILDSLEFALMSLKGLRRRTDILYWWNLLLTALLVAMYVQFMV